LLKGVGKWMDVNGEAVYGTRGGPFLPDDRIASTHKGHFIYLFVMDPSLKEIRLPLPQGVKARRVSLVGGGGVSYDNRDRELLIRIPDGITASPAYVLKIRINRDAASIEPVSLNSMGKAQ
jgi:alpha-L-fucosidase